MTSAVPAGDGRLGNKAAEVLRAELQNLVSAFAENLASRAADRVGGLTGWLSNIADDADDPVKAATAAGAESIGKGESAPTATLKGAVAGIGTKVKQAVGIGGEGKPADKKLKLTNIVEEADVGVPVRVAYNQWTEFADFPRFMKKVEAVEQESDEKATWKAQVLWSHRSWEATIVEQIPDQRIVWRSKGDKGHVDGAVSFHELAPDLTRVLLVLEYHPKGFFEGIGNLWRAQGRRARLELKHYVRHVMTMTVAEQDEIEGWRGEIRDGEVVKDHEAALAEEEQEEQEPEEEEPEQEERAELAEEPDEESAASGEEAENGARSEGSGRPARRKTHAGAAR